MVDTGYYHTPDPNDGRFDPTNPPLPPHLRGRGLADAPLPPTGNPNAPPMPANSGGNSIINFLASLFGAGGNTGGPPQGMTGLLARGRGAPGTDTLGNPVGRF